MKLIRASLGFFLSASYLLRLGSGSDSTCNLVHLESKAKAVQEEFFLSLVASHAEQTFCSSGRTYYLDVSNRHWTKHPDQKWIPCSLFLIIGPELQKIGAAKFASLLTFLLQASDM